MNDENFNEEEQSSKYDESIIDDVLAQREPHLIKLRQRLKSYYLSEEEINDLFKIIEAAEIEMEKIKAGFNGYTYNEFDSIKLKNDLIRIQIRMKQDFEAALNETIKRKYTNAKNKLEELNRKNPFFFN